MNIHWKNWCWSSNTLAPWCEKLTHWKNSDAGKDQRQKEKGQQCLRWLNSITDSVDMNLSKLQEIMEDRGVWHAAVHGISKSWTWLGERTTPTYLRSKGSPFLKWPIWGSFDSPKLSFVYIVRESQQKVCILTMSVSLLEISLQDLLGTVLSFSSFLKLD